MVRAEFADDDKVVLSPRRNDGLTFPGKKKNDVLEDSDSVKSGMATFIPKVGTLRDRIEDLPKGEIEAKRPKLE